MPTDPVAMATTALQSLGECMLPAQHEMADRQRREEKLTALKKQDCCSGFRKGPRVYDHALEESVSGKVSLHM